MTGLSIALLLACVCGALAQYGEGPVPARFQIPGAIALGPKPGNFRQGRVLQPQPQQQQGLLGPGQGAPRLRRPGQQRAGSFKSAPSPTPYLQALEESPKPVTEDPENDIPDVPSTQQTYISSASPFNSPQQLAQDDDLPQIYASPTPSLSKPLNYPTSFPLLQQAPVRQEPIRLPQPVRPQSPPTPAPVKYEAPAKAQPARLAPISYRPPRPQFRPEPRPQLDDEQEEPVRQQVFRNPPARPQQQQQQQAQPQKHSSHQREKKPVAQVIRKYRDDNPDGSITWGFENDDGSFKEEVIGIDCVTRGRYGYVDPDGMKREYTYETGNPCDKNKEQEEQQGFVDYQENKAVLPNGIIVDLANMGKNKSRRPHRQAQNRS